MTTHFPSRIISLTLLSMAAAATHAQEFPSKAIRIYTTAPGGALDLISRVVAQGVGPSLGQTVIVDNRGGSGVAPGELTSKAPPDGHTLAMQSGTLWLSALMQDRVPYDAFRDFAPVTLVANAPSVIVVTASLPVKNIKEFIALARARPGELNYVKISTGASNHLGAELFNSMAKVKIVPISYSGTAPGVADLISGQVQMLVATTTTAGPHIKSGRLKALAVTGDKPSALLPGVPTVTDSGLPGYRIVSNYALFAPAKTPDAVVRRLNQEVMKVVRSPEARERLLNVGTEAVGGTPEELLALMKSEVVVIGKLVKEANIRVE